MAYDWQTHTVSYAEGPSHVLLALMPERSCDRGIGNEEVITWWDMSHERMFNLSKVIRDEENVFEFVDRMGRRFRLQPLTLELYREKVRDDLVGQPDFGDEKEMREFLLSVMFGR